LFKKEEKKKNISSVVNFVLFFVWDLTSNPLFFFITYILFLHFHRDDDDDDKE
jgi:hypothetical protein